jgi:hypothetical protein
LSKYRGLNKKVRCYNQDENQTQDSHTLILVPFDPSNGISGGSFTSQ